MKIEYLESEGFFTSNGFFKIWNYSSGKNFPIFGQYFVPTLRMWHTPRWLFKTVGHHLDPLLGQNKFLVMYHVWVLIINHIKVKIKCNDVKLNSSSSSKSFWQIAVQHNSVSDDEFYQNCICIAIQILFWLKLGHTNQATLERVSVRIKIG